MANQTAAQNFSSFVQADCELGSTLCWFYYRDVDEFTGIGKFIMKLLVRIHSFQATLHFAARCINSEKTSILALFNR